MSDVNLSFDPLTYYQENGGISLLLRAQAYSSKVFGIRSSDELKDHEGSVYMRRHYLWKDKTGSGRIHEILRPDYDRHLHDHPWDWAFSLILSGGYEEIRREGEEEVTRHYQKGDHNMITCGDYHRISNVYPNTVTLFLTGKPTRGWGFLVDGVHIDRKEYEGRP